MTAFYNCHYIITDAQGRITDGWSDGPHPERETTDAIRISDTGGYQFRLCPGGEENPSLHTMEGIPLYRWDGAQALPRTDEEIEADRAAIHPRAAAHRAGAAAGCRLLGGLTGGEPVSVYEMAKAYYPRLWDTARLEALAAAGRLTRDELCEITGENPEQEA